MHFQHSGDLWRDFPELVPAVVAADGIAADVSIGDQIDAYHEAARSRLAATPEAGLPEIQAWRRTFAKMGLKPTQYRCAAESLLRRLRKGEPPPRIHPLIDLCNAVSMVYATPVAVFDISKVAGYLEVRYATGDERYETFSGEIENPQPHEVIFADGAGQAHARRWTNRQSGYSAVSGTTTSVLIVAEALHDSASVDIPKLVGALVDDLTTVWSVTPSAAILTDSEPRFEF